MLNLNTDNQVLAPSDWAGALPKRAAAIGGSTIAAASRLFLLIGFSLLLAPLNLAQYIGSVSIQTVQQSLFPAGTTCTGAPQTATVNNLGQTSHSIVLLQGATATSIKFFLEGSNDGVNFTRISDEFDGILTGPLQASGYYTVVRANVQCNPGTATFGMTYSGSGVPQSQPQGDGLRSQVEKVLVQGVSAGSNQNFGLRAPYGNTAGLLQFTTSGGTFSGAASVTVTCTMLSGTNTTVLNTTTLSGTTQLITIPASPCVSPLVGYSFGTSTGNMTIEYVFSAGFAGGASGTAGTSLTSTTGCVADGTSVTGCNPVTVGGKTSPGSSSPGVAKFATVLGENANDLSAGNYNVLGWAIGAGNLNPANNFSGLTAPNVGPMASSLFAVPANTNAGSPLTQWVSETGSQGSLGVNATGAANSSLNGLLVNKNGISFLSTSQTLNAAGTTNVVVTAAGWNYGTFNSCYVTLTSNAGTGTAPTLDVFLQVSLDGTNFNDRLHFAQVTNASASKQFGGISSSAGITPAPMADGTLAASTKVDGPVGAWIRFKEVVGGTGPAFGAVQVGVVCD